MINAKELRIGNAFRDVRFTEIISLVEQLHSEYIVSSYSDSLSYENMHPIELTPDMLIKCGFKSSYDNDKEYIMSTDNDRVLTINHETFYARYGSSSKWCGCDGFADTQFGISDIQYLHQLQNAWYILSGSELEIKMDEIKNS